MGFFKKDNNYSYLKKTPLKNYAEFSLPDSGSLLMPNFFWLKKNKDSQILIENRMQEIVEIKDVSSQIYTLIISLVSEILRKIEADSQDEIATRKIGEACFYGGLLAFIEIESGLLEQGLVHPAIHSSMILHGLQGDEISEPNISQGINVGVQAGYAKIRFPDFNDEELLANIYKIS